MVAIQRKDESLDLTSVQLDQLKLDDVELIKGEKSYDKSREEELFDMISKGFNISDGNIFKALILATVSN